MENPIGALKEIFRSPELSKNYYSLPFLPSTKILRVETRSESHSGNFKGAIDYIMAPGSEIVSSLEGIVIAVVDDNDKYGPSKLEFKDKLNYITISHENGEFSQYAHLAKDSSLVKPGDLVKGGQKIGITGYSGWMYEPHLHFFVFKGNSPISDFVGLNPRFK